MAKRYESKIGDVFTKEPTSVEVRTNKKVNAEMWDIVDAITQEYIDQLCEVVGIKIIEEGDSMDDIAEIRDMAVKRVEKRFGIKFPYVNENM